MSLEVKEFPIDEEYKKGYGLTAEIISSLRSWLETQPHLPAKYITDIELALAYHSSDQSLENTKKVIDVHFTLKTLLPAFFKDRAVDDVVEKTLNMALLQPLEMKTKEGYSIIYMRFLDFDPKNYFPVNVVRTSLMIMDLWQHEEGTWPGFVLLVDMQGSTFSHVTRWDSSTLQQFMYYLKEATLVKVKGFHFLNATSFQDTLLTMLKPLMRKSLLEILHVHQAGSKNIEKYIPIEALPKESGGQYKSFEECKSHILAKLKANEQYFVEENKRRTNEELRPGKPKTTSDFFGSSFFGSFKKLSID